jgi:hypothetical protein
LVESPTHVENRDGFTVSQQRLEFGWGDENLVASSHGGLSCSDVEMALAGVPEATQATPRSARDRAAASVSALRRVSAWVMPPKWALTAATAVLSISGARARRATSRKSISPIGARSRNSHRPSPPHEHPVECGRFHRDVNIVAQFVQLADRSMAQTIGPKNITTNPMRLT